MLNNDICQTLAGVRKITLTEVKMYPQSDKSLSVKVQAFVREGAGRRSRISSVKALD